VLAPSATRVAHEIGCGNDKEVVGIDVRWRDASSLGDPTGSGILNVSLRRLRKIMNWDDMKCTVCPQLRGDLGMALIDSGSMVSLVKESSVKRFRHQEEHIKLQGITGKCLNVLGLVNLQIENTLEPITQECYVVDRLPRNLNVILGQDWLEKAGYSFQKREPIMIPPYSEQVIKCKTNERGTRFIEHQLLQPGLIAAASLVDCKANEFPCLVVNLTDQTMW
jgi:hypothetical protein